MSSSDSWLAGLAGQRTVVTGGARGIGRATAELLSELGATVVVVDRDISALSQGGGAATIEGVIADVSDPAEVAAAFVAIDQDFDGLDLLIANAGVSARTPALEIDPAEWQHVIDVNLNGAFYCAREAAIRMRSADGGSICMMASTNGLKAHPNYAHYNASKAGVIALARTLAVELAPQIRVNAICPGYVATEMQAAEYTEEMLEAVNRTLPLGRHADPLEIAQLFAFLASDRAGYVTGQAFVIDGGELA
jgi:NAD(P)-dependent dehydrogenase (short-subunit alcohol dehydrogenase family)